MTTDKELEKNKKHNIKLYTLYKMLSWDLLFYYAISFIFLTDYKGLSAAQVIFADSFYPIFKVLFQIPCTLFIEKIGKRISIITGNILLAISILLVLGCNNIYILLISNFIMAIGFVFKNLCESNFLYDSIPNVDNKRKLFSKIDGKGFSAYYLLEAVSCAASGFLYEINPNFPITICFICVLLSTIIAHFFKDIPVDTTNENEEHSTQKSLKRRLKEYMRNLKNAFKFIFSSSRLRCLIAFNALVVALIYILKSYRMSLFSDIGLTATQIGIIFAALGIISSIYSSVTPQIHTVLRNRALTYIGLYLALSVIISGLAVVLNLPFKLMIILVLISQAVQFGIKGPFYTLIKQYLASFASSSMRLKIVTANNIIECIISGIVSFICSYLISITSTANATIILGIASFIMFVILLSHMKTRVGLKPEEYSKREIEFKEVE